MRKNEHKKNRPAAANNRTVDSENGITKAYSVYHQFCKNARVGGEKF